MSIDPNTRRVIYAASGAVTAIVLTPILAPAIVGIFGFGALGPVAGSFAAVTQAGIGNVAAGSAFAVAQSIGMGGAVPAAITAVSAVLGAGVGTAASAADGGSDDEDTGEEEGNTGDDGEGPAGEGAARTGRNRCPECRRRRERYCRHTD